MKLNADPQFDDAAHQISYRVSISEGPQYRMGDMVITGLSLDAEKRLRQAWQIAPGQVFDDGYYEKHMKILCETQPRYFWRIARSLQRVWPFASARCGPPHGGCFIGFQVGRASACSLTLERTRISPNQTG